MMAFRFPNVVGMDPDRLLFCKYLLSLDITSLWVIYNNLVMSIDKMKSEQYCTHGSIAIYDYLQGLEQTKLLKLGWYISTQTVVMEAPAKQKCASSITKQTGNSFLPTPIKKQTTTKHRNSCKDLLFQKDIFSQSRHFHQFPLSMCSILGLGKMLECLSHHCT